VPRRVVWSVAGSLAATFAALLASIYPLHLLKKMPPAHSLRQQ